MKQLYRSLFVVVTLSMSSVASAQDNDERLIQSLTNTVIIPAYQQFAETMAVLAAATTNHCEAASIATRQSVEAAFHDGMNAWQRVQPVNFGPVLRNSRYTRIQYWPDKGGIAARLLRQALSKRDPALLSENGLEGRSVAVQNLSAYERLVFTVIPDTPEDSSYACELAAAIARFQARQAQALLGEWTGSFRESLLAAEVDSANSNETVTALFKSLHSAIDKVIALKLERPLGKSLQAAKPKQAESWRSDRSLGNIAANLRMARDIYAAKYSFGDRLGAGGSRALDTGIRTSLDTLIARFDAIAPALHAAVSQAEPRQDLESILLDIKDLRILIAGPVAEELGLVIGFNALDGD